MTDENNDKDDNVYNIADYRDHVRSDDFELDGDGESIKLTLTGKAAGSVLHETALSGVSPDAAVASYIGLGLENERLLREGWSGPIYQRPKESISKIGKLLTRIGLGYTEHIKLSRSQKSP